MPRTVSILNPESLGPTVGSPATPINRLKKRSQKTELKQLSIHRAALRKAFTKKGYPVQFKGQLEVELDHVEARIKELKTH